MTMNLTLSEQEINVILRCLEEQKLKDTINTYITIQRQVQEAQAAAVQAPTLVASPE